MIDIPHTYDEAAHIFGKARYPTRGKPINHSCRIMQGWAGAGKHPTYALKLHDTEIVTWYSNGDRYLFHDGWTTPTTKEKMNDALRAPGEPRWSHAHPRVEGRMKSGWTHETLGGFGGNKSQRESYFYIVAANRSCVIPDAGLLLDANDEVHGDYQSLEDWLLMEAEEDRVRRRQRREEDTQKEMERFLNSPYACVFTPHKKPLAVVFPRESDAFVPSLVLVDENHRSQLKYEVLAQALENGNRLDIVKTDVIEEAVSYIQTN